MDARAADRDVIEKVLTEYASVPCLVHIDIKGGLVLIQRDGTEHGMAPEPARAGIAPERIVLAFHHREARPYSELLAA